MDAYEKIILVVPQTENSDWTFLKKISQNNHY